MISVTVSLTHDGALQMALPGPYGDRFVRLSPGHEAETLIRVLQAEQGLIATDSAPTSAQVRHWEKHQIFPSDKCAFCQAERQHKRRLRAKAQAAQAVFIAEGGTIKGKIKTLNLEDLDL